MTYQREIVIIIITHFILLNYVNIKCFSDIKDNIISLEDKYILSLIELQGCLCQPNSGQSLRMLQSHILIRSYQSIISALGMHFSVRPRFSSLEAQHSEVWNSESWWHSFLYMLCNVWHLLLTLQFSINIHCSIFIPN